MTSHPGAGASRKFGGRGRAGLPAGSRCRSGAPSAMSGGGPASPSRSGAVPLPSDRKREALAAVSPIQPIIKDVGEIYSRLLDHRPVIQGEIRYFVKEFEEKRGLRELRVLENLKNTIFETNEHVLPKCEQAMHDNLNEAFKRYRSPVFRNLSHCSDFSKRESGLAVSSAICLSIHGRNLSGPVDSNISSLFKCSLNWSSSTKVQAANDMIHRLQEREHEERKYFCVEGYRLILEAT
ncbi:biogenesis of lysosome-related organelles complex 1 subunit 5 isoform X2 [Calonectris borealis]|uniref:biogenesis of lysosome-related organelles complex 1 subunit 5 isoform X2 n=1 Tax=Calonectris borealis TaxID=1323832 RepID=UPI003F4B14CD